MQSKAKRFLFLLAIMLTNVIVMADLAIYVIVNELFGAFPGQINVVNFIVSGPALIVMVSSLLAPMILKKVSKKSLLVFSGIAFAVVSILGAAVNNACYVAAMRGIAGIMMGFTNVVAVAILTEEYEDEGKRAKIIGIYNTIMPLTGSVLSAVAGILARSGWQNIFNVYWVTVPMVILLILFMPKGKRVEAGTDSESSGDKAPMGAKYWIVLVSFFFLVLGTMMLQLFYSVYISEHELGDITFTGLVNTVTGFGSVAANFAFGFMFVKIRRKVLPIAYALPLIGSLILIFFPGRITVFIGYFISLAGYGLAFSAAYAYAPLLVPKSRVEFAIGLATATYAIGTFLSTYAVTGLMSLMKTELFHTTMPVIASIFVLLLIVELVLPRRFKEDEPAKSL